MAQNTEIEVQESPGGSEKQDSVAGVFNKSPRATPVYFEHKGDQYEYLPPVSQHDVDTIHHY